MPAPLILSIGFAIVSIPPRRQCAYFKMTTLSRDRETPAGLLEFSHIPANSQGNRVIGDRLGRVRDRRLCGRM